MADFTKILSKTFTATLVREHSSTARVDDLGKHEQTMDLYYYTGASSLQGFIEWDIPTAEETEQIGLTFEIDAAGTRTLTDYDGVFSLPSEAVALLREAGIVVNNEFDDDATFKAGDVEFDYWDFIKGRSAQTAAWALHAKPGDVCPHAEGCSRTA